MALQIRLIISLFPSAGQETRGRARRRDGETENERERKIKHVHSPLGTKVSATPRPVFSRLQRVSQAGLPFPSDVISGRYLYATIRKDNRGENVDISFEIENALIKKVGNCRTNHVDTSRKRDLFFSPICPSDLKFDED